MSSRAALAGWQFKYLHTQDVVYKLGNTKILTLQNTCQMGNGTEMISCLKIVERLIFLLYLSQLMIWIFVVVATFSIMRHDTSFEEVQRYMGMQMIANCTSLA